MCVKSLVFCRLEKRPRGVLPMIDEECVVPRGSDDSLLSKLMVKMLILY